MKILVCLKAVPTTSQVEVDGQFRLQRSGAALQWNIADEAALELALRLKGNGTVTVLTMGPGKLEEDLISLMARGADRAVLLTDPKMAGADTVATARALAAAAEKLGGFDLILCGRRAIDGETGQVPGMLASALGLPFVTNADTVEEGLLVTRRLETAVQKLEDTLPAVVSVCEYTYPLRLAGIMGMRRARQKQVEKLTAADLGLEAEQCGLKGSLTKVTAMSAKFPGLRKGPKETDLFAAVKEICGICGEVGK